MQLLAELLPIIIYVLLIILLVGLIIVVIKLIKTMNKIELIVDDVDKKVKSLNNFFRVLSFTTDRVAGFSDAIIEKVSSGIGKIFSKKGDRDYE